MSEEPVIWQHRPIEVYTPDHGDTFHLVEELQGKIHHRAMSRATFIVQVGRALEALLGPDAAEALGRTIAQIERERDLQNRPD